MWLSLILHVSHVKNFRIFNLKYETFKHDFQFKFNEYLPKVSTGRYKQSGLGCVSCLLKFEEIVKLISSKSNGVVSLKQPKIKLK